MKKLYPLLTILCLLFQFQGFAQRPGNLLDWLVYSRTGTPYGSVWATDLQGRHIKLLDSCQIARVSQDGRYLLYIRQNGNTNVNQTGTVARMNMRTGQGEDLYNFGDWMVGYDMLLSDSSTILGYSCGMYRQDYTHISTSTIFQVDCFDDAPDLRQRDSMLVYHNEHQGIKLFSLSRGVVGPGVIPNTQPRDYWPQWSPDGNWILFGRRGITNPNDPYRYINNLYKIRPDGSQLTRLTHFAATDTGRFGQNFAWSRDGSQVYATGVLGPNQPYALIAIKADSSGEMNTVLTVPNATISFLHGRPASHVFTVTAAPLAGLSMAIYPNPAKGTVTLRLPPSAVGAVEVTVRDAAGKTVIRQRFTTPKITLPLGQVVPGVYRIEAVTGQAVYGGRLRVE